MRRDRWLTPWRAACIALVVMSSLVFAGSISGLAIWDDIPLINGAGIGGGSLLHVFTRPFLGNYFRPLVSLSFWLERPLWGSGPFGYHQTNLLIHAANTAVMIMLLQAAFKDRRVAFVGAAIFAFHPVHVTAVAWIGGRTDAMLCLFMTCAALCLIRSAVAELERSYRPLLWAGFWYTMALLCKEQALAALPLAPLVYRFFGDRAWDTERKFQARLATFVFAGIAAVFMVCWFLAAPPKQSLLANGFGNHMMRAGDTLFAYAGLLFAPNATWMHTFTLGPTERFGAAGAATGFLLFAALCWYVRVAWKRGCQTAWWALWGVLVILPVSNLVPMATLLVAPYRVEVAQIGLAALGGWFVVGAWDRLARPAPRAMFSLAGAGAGAWCLYLCVWGSGRWLTPEIAFGQICRVDPDCVFARESVVQSLLSRKKYAEASRELEELLERLLPHGRWRDASSVTDAMAHNSDVIARLRQSQGGSIEPNVWLADVYAQLGRLRVDQGDKQNGEAYLQTAVVLDADCFDALLDLGFLDLERGKNTHARFWADRAILRGAQAVDAWSLRGKCDAAMHHWEDARVAFQKCVDLQPWSGQAYIDLAEVKRQLGDRDGAAATLTEALKKSPRRDDIRKRLQAL